MKNVFITICVAVIIFAGCDLNIPSTSNMIVTGIAKDLTSNTAVLYGEVNIDISTYDNVEFGMIISDVKDDLNNRDGEKYEAEVLIGKEFKLELKNLSPETEYYYCAWVFLNNTQYEFGDIKKFRTSETPKVHQDVFSIAVDKHVTFSPGNLQYTQSTDTWSFASAQYEVLGTDNVIGGSVDSSQYDIEKIGYALADKIDLFGWSTSKTHFGVSKSKNYKDYSGSFVDWGTNQIGNDTPNTWRTLTEDEWDYLAFRRSNADNLKGVAQVNGVNGLILLPDNWNCPKGVTFKSGFSSSFGIDCYSQIYTAEQWQKLESSGAVFLPAAGLRDGIVVYDVQGYGNYWSATEYSSEYTSDGAAANSLDFTSNSMWWSGELRFSGISVRLVKDYVHER